MHSHGPNVIPCRPNVLRTAVGRPSARAFSPAVPGRLNLPSCISAGFPGIEVRRREPGAKPTAEVRQRGAALATVGCGRHICLRALERPDLRGDCGTQPASPGMGSYHSALTVQLDGDRFVVEMAPAWGNKAPDRGVVREGAIGLPWLGRSRFFRYEIRRWRNGAIPDIAEAVASSQRVRTDVFRTQAARPHPRIPAVTWGRDELHAGEMWNSNSLIAWLLARSGHRTGAIEMPPHGRAPGWCSRAGRGRKAGHRHRPRVAASRQPTRS